MAYVGARRDGQSVTGTAGQIKPPWACDGIQPTPACRRWDEREQGGPACACAGAARTCPLTCRAARHTSGWVAPAHLVWRPTAREEVAIVIAVKGDIEDVGIVVEGLLGSISVVHVLGEQGAEDPALAGRLWAPGVAGRLRRAPRERGPGTESRAPGRVLVCLPRPRHRATVQLPARGKRPAFQPHPEATVSQTKPSGHCHVCEKGADCSRSPSSTCEVSALCRTLGCSRRPSRGAGRDRCTQHGGPGPQARTTNRFFFF